MRSDDAVSTVVGAILVLAILGLAIVYVDAFHVPHQGAALEVQGKAAASDAMGAARGLLLQDPSGGPRALDLPLRPPASSPPLLSGVVLSPARADGTLSLDPSRTNLTISHVTSGGAPPNDPMRAAVSPGLVRVYDLGNATAGAPVGSLSLRMGGAYTPSAAYRLEAGALLVDRGAASGMMEAPALRVSSVSGATRVSWRIPVLAGAAAEVSGGEAAQVSLAPGPLASVGGGDAVQSVTIRVDTDALGAWTSALQSIVGSHGSVVSTPSGPADNGTVVATISSAGSQPSVQLDLSLVRYDATLAVRSAG